MMVVLLKNKNLNNTLVIKKLDTYIISSVDDMTFKKQSLKHEFVY